MKKIQNLLVICLFTTATILFFTGCQDDPNPEDLPVATIGLVNEWKTSGTIRILAVVSEGTNPTAILDWGVCTNDNIDPTIDDHVFSCGSGIYSGSKTIKVRDLGITEPGNYSLRIYATNSYGTAYSSNYSLAILDADFIPTVSAYQSTFNITLKTSPQCGPSIIEAGLYWDENPGITNSDNFYTVMDLNPLTTFDDVKTYLLEIEDITGVPGSGLYEGSILYFKGYVKNSDGVEILTEEKVYTVN